MVHAPDVQFTYAGKYRISKLEHGTCNMGAFNSSELMTILQYLKQITEAYLLMINDAITLLFNLHNKVHLSITY